MGAVDSGVKRELLPPTWNKWKMQTTSLTPAISRSLPQLWFVGSGLRFQVESVEIHLKKTAFPVKITQQNLHVIDWSKFERSEEKRILYKRRLRKMKVCLNSHWCSLFSDPVDVQLVHVWHCWSLPILFLHLARPHPACYRVAAKVRLAPLHIRFQPTCLPNMRNPQKLGGRKFERVKSETR